MPALVRDCLPGRLAIPTKRVKVNFLPCTNRTKLNPPYTARKTRYSSGKLSTKSERGLQNYLLREDVEQSRLDLQYERGLHQNALAQNARVERFAGLPRNLRSLTETETLDYALMLSRDEEESRRARQIEAGFDPDTGADTLEDLEFLALDDDGELPSPSLDYLDDSDDESLSSRSVTSPGSPYSSWIRRSPVLGSSADMKLLSSPRPSPFLSPTLLPHDMSPVPDFHDSAWPLPSPSGRSSTPQGNTATPSSISLPPSAGTPGHKVMKGWNEIARSPPSTVTTPSRQTRHSASPRPSPSPSNLSATAQEERDLRLAIDLSLADLRVHERPLGAARDEIND